MSDEPVMFVRHSGGGFLGDRWAQDWLFGGDDNPPRISIHYQDKASFDSSDYSYRPRRIRRFEKAASTPTISVVGFSEKTSGEKYITRTIPGSREIVVMNVDNEDIVQVEEVKEEGSAPDLTAQYEDDGQYRVVKTLQVEEWKCISQENHKLLWDWHSQDALHDPSKNATEKARYIRAVYHEDSKPLITTSLSHHDQELIAEKYLRDKLDDFTLDAPRGGALENIDLLGTVKDESAGGLKTVVASVTSSSGSHRRDRIKTINSLSDRDEVYFFDAEESRPVTLHNDVTYVSLENVFVWMNEDDTRRHRSLHTMLGLRDEV
jgi:hypothetical protein